MDASLILLIIAIVIFVLDAVHAVPAIVSKNVDPIPAGLAFLAASFAVG